MTDILPSVRPLVTLATSVPPSSSRLDHNGANVGVQYQEACLKSWSDAGAVIISVNPEDEREVVQKQHPGIRIVGTPKDGREHFSRPLVYLADLFEELRKSTSEVVGIVNADILFRGDSSTISKLIAPALAGQFVTANRFEVASPSADAGHFYSYGFDLFLFRKELLDSFLVEGFLLGVPWWDYWLPLNARLNGMEVAVLRSPAVCHLTHDQRWDVDLWQSGLSTLLRHLRAKAPPWDIEAEGASSSNSTLFLARLGQFVLDAMDPDSLSAYGMNGSKEALGVGLGVFLVNDFQRA